MFINGTTTTESDHDWWNGADLKPGPDLSFLNWIWGPIGAVITVVAISIRYYLVKRARARAVANGEQIGQCGAATHPRPMQTNQVQLPAGAYPKQQTALPTGAYPTQQSAANGTGFDNQLYTNQYGTVSPPPAYQPPSYNDATNTVPS